MSDIVDRIGPERAWLGTVLALLVGVIGGSLAFPETVYDGFVWRYFWGPVVADAHGFTAVERAGVVAEPGYTTVSTVSYAFVLLLLLFGVLSLIDRLDVGTSRSFFFALVPFVFFGGALRTIEDANVAVYTATGEFVIPFPWTALIISPFIYGTVFALALVALLTAVWMARRGVVARYEYPLAATGGGLALAALGSLAVLAVTSTLLSFYWIVPTVVLAGATIVAVAVWHGTERFAPDVNAGTGLVGPVVVWGHTVDGIANVLALDWAEAIGLPGGYSPKHVVNRAIIGVTETVQPAWLSDAVGTAWPFLIVKVAVAVIVVWLFNEEVMEESPRFSTLLLVAVLAVGLGPGTRDFLRATFGI